MNYVPFALQVCAALYIVWRGIIALNAMSRTTRHDARLAYIFLVVGGVSAIVAGFTQRDIFECLIVVGFALYLRWNKRGEPRVT